MIKIKIGSADGSEQYSGMVHHYCLYTHDIKRSNMKVGLICCNLYQTILLVLSVMSCCSGMTTSPPAVTSSCAVVGVGVLGTHLCEQLASLGTLSVTGITKTVNRHEEIREKVSSEKFELFTLDQMEEDRPFENVVFCAPPSGFEDYPGAVKHAAEKLWNKKGVFVFTSSGAV
jgi:hypothetical protein